MSYVIKSKDSVLQDYALFVADSLAYSPTMDGLNVTWELSHMDNPEDATRFEFINDALVMMEIVKLHEDDWEVIPC